MDAIVALARRWPYSAAATFVGLMWIAYAWSIWMAGGIGPGSGMTIGGLGGSGYWLTGSLFTLSITHDHEWERLVSSIFLHGGFLHILLNSAGILQLGRILESFTTRGRCWFTLLVSGLAGSLVTLVWALITKTPGNAVGASGAGCGVGAALIVLSRGIPSLEEFRKQMITWVGIMFLMGLLPMISGTGHFGGAIGGGVAGMLLRRRGSIEVKWDRYGRALASATVVLTVVFAVALVLTVKRTLDRRTAFDGMTAATNDVHIWLDQGSVSDFATWREGVTQVKLPSILEPNRLALIYLAQRLAAAPGGAIDTPTAEAARVEIDAISWW